MRKRIWTLLAAFALAASWPALAETARHGDARTVHCAENRPGCMLLQMTALGSFDDYDPEDTLCGRVLSAVYPQLCAIEKDDFEHCSEERDLDEAGLRHSYNVAMANCLWADIMTEGLSEGRMSAARRVLLLFLNPGGEADAEAQMAAIREGMTDEVLTRIAEAIGAPEDFVQWLIESDDWRADAGQEAPDVQSPNRE